MDLHSQEQVSTSSELDCAEAEHPDEGQGTLAETSSYCEAVMPFSSGRSRLFPSPPCNAKRDVLQEKNEFSSSIVALPLEFKM